MGNPDDAILRLTQREFDEHISRLLVTGGLYQELFYAAEEPFHGKDNRNNEVGRLPSLLTKYCSGRDCGQLTRWETSEPTVWLHGKDLHERTYRCRNCHSSEQNYWFKWSVKWTDDFDKTASFMKTGQFPPLSIEPPKELAKALGDSDNNLYRKALINGSHSFGLGALVYFRRVIENKVNMLLDMIGDAANLAEFAPEQVSQIEAIKQSHRLDEKIKFASGLLPPNLKPGGHNPLDRLYAVASAGIHGKSDEECLDDFNTARFEFEYLFKNLSVSTEDAREFLKRVSSPLKQSK